MSKFKLIEFKWKLKEKRIERRRRNIRKYRWKFGKSESLIRQRSKQRKIRDEKLRSWRKQQKKKTNNHRIKVVEESLFLPRNVCHVSVFFSFFNYSVIYMVLSSCLAAVVIGRRALVLIKELRNNECKYVIQYYSSWRWNCCAIKVADY